MKNPRFIEEDVNTFVLNQKFDLKRNIYFRSFSWKNSSSIKELINSEIQQLLFKEDNSWQQLNLARMSESQLMKLREEIFLNCNEYFDPEYSNIFKRDNVNLVTNTDDHIRLIFSSSLPQRNLFSLHSIYSIENKLNEYFHFSFLPNFGYLSATPLDCGLGLSLSALLHLPALTILEKIPEICDVISKFGFYLTEYSYSNTVKGGNCYVLKNVYSFGSEAEELYSCFIELIDDIFQREEKAKKNLMSNYRSPIFDKIYRSFGIIKYAYRISYQEVLNLISFIRLGQDFDIISKENTTILYDIFWNTMPGCFKYSKGLENGKEENVDEERSIYIKEKLKKWVYLNE